MKYLQSQVEKVAQITIEIILKSKSAGEKRSHRWVLKLYMHSSLVQSGQCQTKIRAGRPESLRSFIPTQNSSTRGLTGICAAREQLQPKSISLPKAGFSRARATDRRHRSASTRPAPQRNSPVSQKQRNATSRAADHTRNERKTKQPCPPSPSSNLSRAKAARR